MARIERAVRAAALLLLTVLSAAASSAQPLSADGRSVVGRTTMLDRLVRFLDPDRLLIGLSSDELKLWGERLYPEEGHLHNRAGHRLGSRILTDRFGPVMATALGIANEVFEAYNLRHIGAPVISTERFDLEDLAANFRGLCDSYATDLNTPWGLLRLLRGREALRFPSETCVATIVFGTRQKDYGVLQTASVDTELHVRPCPERRLPHRRDTPHAW